MKRRYLIQLILAAALTTSAAGQTSPGGDWPQWHGPDRTNVSKESGLARQWPAAGPPMAWSVGGVGAGYGTVAIKDDRIFVQGSAGGRSVVYALSRADGKGLWSKALGPAGRNDRGSGPRSTPTVDGDRVYVLTENGDLACLKSQDGSAVWQRNVLKDFGGRNINWLLSESPLVDGNNVIVTPGGQSAGMVALDKMTGQTVWVAKELSDEAGYASAIAADVSGVRTIMTLTGEAGIGVRAADGKLMWRQRNVANRTANIATPVFSDNKVFYTSGYGTGAALIGLTAQAGEVNARELYFTREMQNHHGGVVLVNGFLRLQQLDPERLNLRPARRCGVIAASARLAHLCRRTSTARRRATSPVWPAVPGAYMKRAVKIRQGVAGVGAPGRERRPALHPEPGHAVGLRRSCTLSSRSAKQP